MMPLGVLTGPGFIFRRRQSRGRSAEVCDRSAEVWRFWGGTISRPDVHTNQGWRSLIDYRLGISLGAFLLDLRLDPLKARSRSSRST
jgi:hypothetical protein